MTNTADQGVNEPSSSPRAAGVVLFEKKDDTKRFCVDYRSINSRTVIQFGSCSYNLRFIAGSYSIAKPLFRMREKVRVFKWTTECNEALEITNMSLGAPILVHPDFLLPFFIPTLVK